LGTQAGVIHEVQRFIPHTQQQWQPNPLPGWRRNG